MKKQKKQVIKQLLQCVDTVGTLAIILFIKISMRCSKLRLVVI